MKHRWPRSIHCQVEAVFHSIRSFKQRKADNSHGLRSFGSWDTYRKKAHHFATFLHSKGITSLLDTLAVRNAMEEYLRETLTDYVKRRRSRQTLETLLAALGKFEYAVNNYITLHGIETLPLDTKALRLEYYARSRKLLPKSSRLFDNRAYPDPIRLIENIHDGTYQLQASLQYEGGFRAEGVGAPSSRRVKNPLTTKGLRGIGTDPVTGSAVGIVASKEKGGKESEHFVSVETYRRLEAYIQLHGKLASDYSGYSKSRSWNMTCLATSSVTAALPYQSARGLPSMFLQYPPRTLVALYTATTLFKRILKILKLTTVTYHFQDFRA